VLRLVAVEKVGSSEKSGKSGDGKCLGDWGKSFVELPDAKRFLRICGERVFQQPPLLQPPIYNIWVRSAETLRMTGESLC